MIFPCKTLLRKKKARLRENIKIFVRHMPDKRLASRIYKEFSELSSKKTTQLKTGRFEQMLHQRRF